jgi:hypothetical protein
MYFETDLRDLSRFRLSESDWDILEVLEAVLLVSCLLKPGQSLIAPAGSSHISAKHVI